MKRNLEDDREIESLAMNNCMMILTRVGGSGNIFRCKTCNKQFPSFQALGGHSRSHKKLINSVDDSSEKAKTHDQYICSICGLKFDLGQALGGHMRLHRDIQPKKSVPVTVPPVDDSTRGLLLDLNLTPFQNQLKTFSRTGTTSVSL